MKSVADTFKILRLWSGGLCIRCVLPERCAIVFFFFFFFFTREHILNSYCMKEETDMTDYS